MTEHPGASAPTDPKADSPLAARMSAGAEEARQALAQRFAFGSGGFAALADTASRTHDRFAKAGASERALARLADARRLLAEVGRLLGAEENAPGGVPPTNAEIYGAALSVVRWEDVGSLLGGPWSDRALRWAEADADPARTGHDHTAERALLMFAAACKRAQIRTTPGEPEATGAAATVELNRWTVGVGVGVAERGSIGGSGGDAGGDPGSTDPSAGFAEAAARGARALREVGAPGLVLVEITDALPDHSRASRVDTDATGLAEMQSIIDRTLVDARLDLAHAANGLGDGAPVTVDAPVFGLIACATMRSTIVSSVRVGFATLFRAVNLCELSDPRAERLAWFLERFGRA